MFIIIITLIITIIVLLIAYFFWKRQPLKPGTLAPEFSLPDENNRIRSLREFLGKKVVLYFYPKDHTPGCTKQACSLRDNFDALQKQNIVVIGISYDSTESHKRFKQDYKLPFILLSDMTHIVSRNYGAAQYKWGPFQLPFPKRITFLINEEGKIVDIIKSVNVDLHADQIVAAFKNATIR